MLLKSSVCLLIFGPCCLIRSAFSIASSCLLWSVASIITFGSIWDPVMLLLWICWWCFLIAACCLNLSLIVVRVCPTYVDWEVVHSPWLHVYWYTTLNGWSGLFGLFLMNRFLTFRFCNRCWTSVLLHWLFRCCYWLSLSVLFLLVCSCWSSGSG